MYKKTIVIVTGGFDPLHEGHIEYFNDAKALSETYPTELAGAGQLWVGLNSDEWLARKKGSPFMTFVSRHVVISNIRSVDKVIQVNDDDNTSIDAIRQVMAVVDQNTRIVFANGGDRTLGNVPEKL